MVYSFVYNYYRDRLKDNKTAKLSYTLSAVSSYMVQMQIRGHFTTKEYNQQRLYSNKINYFFFH